MRHFLSQKMSFSEKARPRDLEFTEILREIWEKLNSTEERSQDLEFECQTKAQHFYFRKADLACCCPRKIKAPFYLLEQRRSFSARAYVCVRAFAYTCVCVCVRVVPASTKILSQSASGRMPATCCIMHHSSRRNECGSASGTTVLNNKTRRAVKCLFTMKILHLADRVVVAHVNDPLVAQAGGNKFYLLWRGFDGIVLKIASQPNWSKVSRARAHYFARWHVAPSFCVPSQDI